MCNTLHRSVTLQHTAIRCHVLQNTATHRIHTEYVVLLEALWMYDEDRVCATHCNKLQHAAQDGMRAEYVRIVGGAAAVWGGWSVCHTLQHTATHCTGRVSVYARRCTRVQLNRSNSQVASSPMSLDHIILSHQRVFLIIHVTVRYISLSPPPSIHHYGDNLQIPYKQPPVFIGVCDTHMLLTTHVGTHVQRVYLGLLNTTSHIYTYMYVQAYAKSKSHRD